MSHEFSETKSVISINHGLNWLWPYDLGTKKLVHFIIPQDSCHHQSSEAAEWGPLQICWNF